MQLVRIQPSLHFIYDVATWGALVLMESGGGIGERERRKFRVDESDAWMNEWRVLRLVGVVHLDGIF